MLKKPLVVIKRSLFKRLTIDTHISNHLNKDLRLRKDLSSCICQYFEKFLTLSTLWK